MKKFNQTGHHPSELQLSGDDIDLIVMALEAAIEARDRYAKTGQPLDIDNEEIIVNMRSFHYELMEAFYD